jgi:putative ABC transport system permease protein
VLSDFVETIGLPIVQGRAFNATDAASSGGVAIVNETLARAYWKGQNPIGQRLRPGGTEPWLTVIGVARDVKQAGVDQPVYPEIYVLVDQLATDTLTSFLSISPAALHVVLRTTLPLGSLAPALTRAVGEVSRAVPVAQLRDMDEVFTDSIRRPRLLAQMLTVFAGLALVLAAIGTYGVLSYMVAERRREVGIRLALGAERLRVLWQVMRYGLMLAGSGLIVGIAAALGVTRLVASLLFGVDPADPATLVVVFMLLTAVAVFACWFPAWRASRLDPNALLRME